MQKLLPFGTPGQVQAEARRYSEVLGSNGGYILGPAHFFQPDVPPETHTCGLPVGPSSWLPTAAFHLHGHIFTDRVPGRLETGVLSISEHPKRDARVE